MHTALQVRDERLVKTTWASPHCTCPHTLAKPLSQTPLQVWDERLVKTELGVATLRLADVLEQRRFKGRLHLSAYPS